FAVSKDLNGKFHLCNPRFSSLSMQMNMDKFCEKKIPIFSVQNYREYSDTQVRKLNAQEIDEYMLKR
ncbi:MAG: hypothetical protein K2F81_07580, partial [Ruminococcus sp.]|nr:hypothetical protein [Ruminococcus sp.]